MALVLFSSIAQAAQEAAARQLASGAGDPANQSHPILAAIIHVIFIIVVVSVAATLFSAFINPQSNRR
jgi:hypothetical protein